MKANMDEIKKMALNLRPLLLPHVEQMIATGNCDKVQIVKLIRSEIYRYTGIEDWALSPEDQVLINSLDTIDEALKLCRETTYETKLNLAKQCGLDEYPGDVSYLMGILFSIVVQAVNEHNPGVFNDSPHNN